MCDVDLDDILSLISTRINKIFCDREFVACLHDDFDIILKDNKSCVIFPKLKPIFLKVLRYQAFIYELNVFCIGTAPHQVTVVCKKKSVTDECPSVRKPRNMESGETRTKSSKRSTPRPTQSYYVPPAQRSLTKKQKVKEHSANKKCTKQLIKSEGNLEERVSADSKNNLCISEVISSSDCSCSTSHIELLSANSNAQSYEDSNTEELLICATLDSNKKENDTQTESTNEQMERCDCEKMENVELSQSTVTPTNNTNSNVTPSDNTTTDTNPISHHPTDDNSSINATDTNHLSIALTDSNPSFKHQADINPTINSIDIDASIDPTDTSAGINQTDTDSSIAQCDANLTGINSTNSPTDTNISTIPTDLNPSIDQTDTKTTINEKEDMNFSQLYISYSDENKKKIYDCDTDNEKEEMQRAIENISRKRRPLIKNTRNGHSLWVSEPKDTSQYSTNLTENAKNQCRYDTECDKEDSSRVDDWEDMFDENGELHSEYLGEILKQIGCEVKVIKATNDYSAYENTKYEDLEHVIELYDFPPTLKTQDIMQLYRDASEDSMYVKWCDDTHCLLVLSTPAQAQRALQIDHEIIKSRPLECSSAIAIMTANSSDLKPAMKRPQTNMQTARRLINRHLGTKPSLSKEDIELERQALRDAREQRRLERQSEKDAWEGNPRNAKS